MRAIHALLAIVVVASADPLVRQEGRGHEEDDGLKAVRAQPHDHMEALVDANGMVSAALKQDPAVDGTDDAPTQKPAPTTAAPNVPAAAKTTTAEAEETTAPPPNTTEAPPPPDAGADADNADAGEGDAGADKDGEAGSGEGGF
mmetsp:Transcript_19922/g.45974  ORF Transcript_19922/g.45974 Transcript_19922/m.45974 type:complete len:144 (+) Transcript_19922:74-505(+)